MWNMADIFSKKKRSEIMSKIRSKDTKPEIIAKLILKEFEYQPKEFGRPDFINYKKKIVLFIDGCFWHCCPIHSKIPEQNKGYWIPKLERNLTRAKEVEMAYKMAGWRVVRIWEHELSKLRNRLSFQKLV